MTSEERVLEFFDVFPAKLPELRKAFKRHLDQHAAEARAEHCECTDRWPDGRPLPTEKEILNDAIEWWLLEGYKSFDGAPAWVFSARQLIDGERI